MISRPCPRCHTLLSTEDRGTLTYCFSCGAPQITLSEELREQLEQQLRAPSPADIPPPELPADPHAVLWPQAVRLTGLAGLLCLALFLLTNVVPPLSLLAMLWIVGAPIILIGVYAARHPRTHLTTSFGAQLGLLTGLSMSAALFLISTLSLVFSRFVFHHGAEIELAFNTSIATAKTQILTQPDAADALALLDRFNIPEFRAGFGLFGVALLGLFYMVYSTLAGAFSGFLRSRAHPR